MVRQQVLETDHSMYFLDNECVELDILVSICLCSMHRGKRYLAFRTYSTAVERFEVVRTVEGFSAT